MLLRRVAVLKGGNSEEANNMKEHKLCKDNAQTFPLTYLETQTKLMRHPVAVFVKMKYIYLNKGVCVINMSSYLIKIELYGSCQVSFFCQLFLNFNIFLFVILEVWVTK